MVSCRLRWQIIALLGLVKYFMLRLPSTRFCSNPVGVRSAPQKSHMLLSLNRLCYIHRDSHRRRGIDGLARVFGFDRKILPAIPVQQMGRRLDIPVSDISSEMGDPGFGRFRNDPLEEICANVDSTEVSSPAGQANCDEKVIGERPWDRAGVIHLGISDQQSCAVLNTASAEIVTFRQLAPKAQSSWENAILIARRTYLLVAHAHGSAPLLGWPGIFGDSKVIGFDGKRDARHVKDVFHPLPCEERPCGILLRTKFLSQAQEVRPDAEEVHGEILQVKARPNIEAKVLRHCDR